MHRTPKIGNVQSSKAQKFFLRIAITSKALLLLLLLIICECLVTLIIIIIIEC